MQLILTFFNSNVCKGIGVKHVKTSRIKIVYGVSKCEGPFRSRRNSTKFMYNTVKLCFLTELLRFPTVFLIPVWNGGLMFLDTDQTNRCLRFPCGQISISKTCDNTTTSWPRELLGCQAFKRQEMKWQSFSVFSLRSNTCFIARNVFLPPPYSVQFHVIFIGKSVIYTSSPFFLTVGHCNLFRESLQEDFSSGL